MYIVTFDMLTHVHPLPPPGDEKEISVDHARMMLHKMLDRGVLDGFPCGQDG